MGVVGGVQTRESNLLSKKRSGRKAQLCKNILDPTVNCAISILSSIKHLNWGAMSIFRLGQARKLEGSAKPGF